MADLMDSPHAAAPDRATATSRVGRDLFFNLAEVRAKLAAASPSSAMAHLWQATRRVAAAQPQENPWMLPFVAAVTGDATMVRAAKEAIDSYLTAAEQKAEPGYLYNIWCFSFPHCRWAMWFDLLRGEGAYEPDEAAQTVARFLLIQHRDHHAGMLVKPHPECVDNQAASLALSSLVLGTLFADEPGAGELCTYMRDAGAQRVEAMLGGMPNSGYSGEGSTYQGRIVAFAVPFLLEMLEDLRGGDLFEAPLQPKGTKTRAILEMTARLWMPGGILLPWDDYGYQHGVRFPIAYLAHRSGDPAYLALLEEDANWSRFSCESAGWGFDESIWALIYWPQTETPAMRRAGWLEPAIGGAQVSPDGSLYQMQMWDHTGPMCTREHVNPNALVFAIDGWPLNADGTPATNDLLQYEGAIHERNFGGGIHQTLNLSKGCAGAHSCLIVDGREGMRPATKDYAESHPLADAQGITGDVTALYQASGIDASCVRRRSRLVDDRYWLVEDLAVFASERRGDNRWWFRPGAVAVDGGFDVVVPEGVGQQWRALVGTSAATVTRLDGYPRTPDGASDRVDVAATGREHRWLWLVWPTRHYAATTVTNEHWQSGPTAGGERFALAPSTIPWFLADVPVVADWTYRTTLQVPADGEWLLRLPAGIGASTQVVLGGQTIPIERDGHGLIPVDLPCPAALRGQTQVDLELTLKLPVRDQDAKEHGDSGCHAKGPVQVLVPSTGPTIADAAYADGRVSFTLSTGETLATDHTLLSPEAN